MPLYNLPRSLDSAAPSARSGWPALAVHLTCALALVLIRPAPSVAQEADPADVSSIDAIMLAVYDVISGDAGEPRDWDRFRSLFTEGATLSPVGPRPGGGFGRGIMTPDEYVESAGQYLEENGFHETEVHRVTERYGMIAHAFSTYESRREADDPEPFTRGINSFQLMNDGERWWVVSIFWQGEGPDNPIPAQYLGGH